MENNFDLRKFLSENKLTTNSRNSVDEIGMFHDPRPSGNVMKAHQEDKDAVEDVKQAIADGMSEEDAIEKVADKYNLYTHYLAKIYKRDSSLKEADNYPNSSQVDDSDKWKPLVDKLFETMYQRIVSIPRDEMIDAIIEFVNDYQGYDVNDKKGMFKAASHLFKLLSLDYLDESIDSHTDDLYYAYIRDSKGFGWNLIGEFSNSEDAISEIDSLLEKEEDLEDLRMRKDNEGDYIWQHLVQMDYGRRLPNTIAKVVKNKI